MLRLHLRGHLGRCSLRGAAQRSCSLVHASACDVARPPLLLPPVARATTVLEKRHPADAGGSSRVDEGALDGRPRTLAGAVRLLVRAAYLGLVLLPPLMLLLPAALLGSAAWMQRFERALLRALERGGPCLIKLGQWASTRPDVLPYRLCRTLGSLHDCVPPHGIEHTRSAIAQAFGRPAEEVFGALSVEPVGSGCVAQVHLATAADGTRLAVKVLHPRVEEIIAADLFLLRAVAFAVRALLTPLVPGLRWLSLQEAVGEFAAFMTRQLDLRLEATNLHAFGRNFAREPRVVFPAPAADKAGEIGSTLSARRVLAETFIDGVTLSSMLRDADGAGGADADAQKAQLAALGLKAFLAMLLKHNFVHADLHPGNIIVCGGGGAAGAGVGGAGAGELRLGFVDAGLVVELSESDRRNFLALFKAIAMGDGEGAGHLMLVHSRENECADPQAFRDGISALVARARAGERGAFNLRNLRIGDVLLEVTSLVRTHRVKVESSFTTLVMAIVVLEGLGRELDPSLDLFSLALPMLATL